MKQLVEILEKKIEFTPDEIRADITKVEDAYGVNDVKIIAQKYDLNARKKGDVQQHLLELLRDLRNQTKQYTHEDELDFRRLTDYCDQYKKLVTYLDQENIKFVEFLRDELFDRMKSKGIDKKMERLAHYPKSEWRYVCNGSEKNMIDRYTNYVKYLNEKDPKTISSKEEQKNLEAIVRSILVDQTQDFYDEMLKNTERRAKEFFKSIPSRVAELDKQIKTYEDEIEELSGKGYSRDIIYKKNDLIKQRNKLSTAKNYFNTILSDGEKNYVEKSIEDSKRRYNICMDELSKKINEKEMVVDDLKVNYITSDPKLYEMLITDGTKKLYARSIWAAEYSEKVTPHYRFLITNRK